MGTGLNHEHDSIEPQPQHSLKEKYPEMSMSSSSFLLKANSNKMDIKIPTALWKSQLLKLVNEAPRAVCVPSSISCSALPSVPPPPPPTSCSASSIGDESSGGEFERRSTSPEPPQNYTSLIDPNTNTIERFVVGSSSSVSNSSHHDSDLRLLSEEENPFGPAFHGYLSSSQALQLLHRDGEFLVRKKTDSVEDDDFILSFRFNGQLKNFLLSWDDSTGFIYIGDKNKSYRTLQELVQEGLITMYLDSKAGSYIDLMCDLTDFHLSLKSSSTRSCNSRNNNGAFSSSSSPSPTGTSYSSSNHNGTILTTTSMECEINCRQRRFNSSASKLDLKIHSFEIHTFEGLTSCQVCRNFMWGLSSQGLQCKDCGLRAHESCSSSTLEEESIHFPCQPQLESIPMIFGTNLTQLVKAGGGIRPPFILEKLITEIESRGLLTEGIYRVSGSRELTERLKSYLEQDRLKADLSSYLDIHSMCSLVKSYLRQLPVPLITHEVFGKFLCWSNGPFPIEIIRRHIKKLPTSHQITLQYLLIHLHHVTTRSDKNKMTPFNLSSVFTPTIICPSEISLSNLKIGTSLLETMITNVPILYPSST